MSYATVETTTTKAAKVDGGSRIEIVSAGLKHGNVGKIMLNGEQVLTTRNAAAAVKMSGATMSSSFSNGDVKVDAEIALKDSDEHFHTKCGEDEWWSALFGGKFKVHKIKI
jgi:hypothetical protein